MYQNDFISPIRRALLPIAVASLFAGCFDAPVPAPPEDGQGGGDTQPGYTGSATIIDGSATVTTANLFPAGNRVAALGEVTDETSVKWSVPSQVRYSDGTMPIASDLYNSHQAGHDYADTPSALAALNGDDIVVVDESGEVITAFVFADNYFEMYVNGVAVGKDAVPFTDFNSSIVRFKVDPPFNVAMLLVDWEEHLGAGTESSNNADYHPGGGGVVAVFKNAAGEIIGKTDSQWKAQTFYTAPLTDLNCLEESEGQRLSSSCSTADLTSLDGVKAAHWALPEAWHDEVFNDSTWPQASEFTNETVGINNKAAYTRFTDVFDDAINDAQFIWSSNLVLDNEVIVRGTVGRVINEALFNIVLGRPSNESISISVEAAGSASVFVEYGTSVNNLETSTALVAAEPSLPTVVELTGLTPNTRYYYRVVKRDAQGDNTYGNTHSFHTQRSVSETFSFGVQGDTHPERKDAMFTEEIYRINMQNVAQNQPDFYIMLGDDFGMESLVANSGSGELTQENANTVYSSLRDYLTEATSSTALYHVNGNHELAALYLYNGNYTHDAGYPDLENTPIFAANARNNHYPLPAPDSFYTGDTTLRDGIGLLRDYYAWTWGDALFVTIDPYWHSEEQVDSGIPPLFNRTADTWDVTMGDQQYEWFKNTLRNSDAKYKFVFAHHVLGTGRGAAAIVHSYEWGGYSGSGRKYEFTERRPTWEKPIHQLMVENNVTIFFQGHDHTFAREIVDGIVYQSMPNPADDQGAWEVAAPNYTHGSDEFPEFLFQGADYDPDDTVILPSPGYLNVTVAEDKVTVDYIPAVAPDQETENWKNNQVYYRYEIE